VEVQTVEKLLLRIPEAADTASISRAKAYDLIKRGEWSVVKVGSELRVVLADLREWIETQKVKAHVADD
jgi:excisionase family DNA binding protein